MGQGRKYLGVGGIDGWRGEMGEQGGVGGEVLKREDYVCTRVRIGGSGDVHE